MDSREAPPAQQKQQQPPRPAMLMPRNPFHSSRNPNSAAMIVPPSTSPAIHHPSAAAAGVRLPFSSLQHQPHMEQKVLDPLVLDGSPSSAEKKKRGRPRKYAPDGNIALGLAPNSPLPSASSSYGGVNASSADPPPKRHRGRSPGPGSFKKQLDALGATEGVGFTPHVIKVETGEDIAAKLMAFSQQGRRAICILSATGAVSNVTLRQAGTSNAAFTYAGRFEIVSLSGSLLSSESNRTGTLSVSVAGPNGRVLGGVVAGMLVAASQVQVIVGSFVPDGRKPRQRGKARGTNPEAASGQCNVLSPKSQGGSNESSSEDDNGSPMRRSNNHRMYGNSGTRQPLQHRHSMHRYPVRGHRPR